MATPNPWILAIRPNTLPAAAAPVLLGSAAAFHQGGFQPLSAFVCLLGAILLQIGANLANDYFDFKKGADSPFRLGPTRVTQSGLISPQSVLIATGVTFFLAAIVGVYLIFLAGMPILYIGVACIVAAILYTGGPLPYGYRGLGELFVFTFFGPVAVMGTEFVQTGKLSALGILASVPCGLLCANILIVNNIRDRDQDRDANKMTLIARHGRRLGLELYLTNLGIAFCIAEIMVFQLRHPWGMLTLLLLPIGWRLFRRIDVADGRALNPLLGETAQFQLIFSAVLSLAVLIDAL